MSRLDELKYGVFSFRVGKPEHIGRASIFHDKSVLCTDGYGSIIAVTNKERLVRISLPDAIEDISIDEISNGVFSDCQNLEIAMLPDSIEKIGDMAFFNCKKLRVAALSNTLYKIGESAFESCALESIVLPSSLEEIGSRSFYGCKSLRHIKFLSPVTLASLCFSSCESLKEVELPMIAEIPDGAFMASGVETVFLPSSLRRIGFSAFSRCRMLRAIHYDGTIEDFRRISFGMNWNKDISSDCALFVKDAFGREYNAFEEKKEERKANAAPEDIKKDLELLGISSLNPTLSDISSSYRSKARAFHPDVLSGLNLDREYSEFASMRFRTYTEAYNRLVAFFGHKKGAN